MQLYSRCNHPALRRLRGRVVHIISYGVMVAKHTSSGARLLGWQLLNPIMGQIRLVLNGAISGMLLMYLDYCN